MISKEEVRHIAQLARLGLAEGEMEKFQKDLSSILDYVEKLKEVDVSGIEPMSHSVLKEGASLGREDGARVLDPKERNKIIEQVPETQDGYLKVKSILNGAD